MQKPTKILEIFAKYAPLVDHEIKSVLEIPATHDMYKMLQYFMGYLDENLQPTVDYGGKKFRSGLALLIADMYGKLDAAGELAASIEIFHNFTLIHDDIVDRDELRRGRQTVWKKWGVDHAINSGDAQMILAYKPLERLALRDANLAFRLQSFLSGKYLEVTEGQHLDFNLHAWLLDDPRVSEDLYMTMIEKKTSVLVGAATGGVGIALGLAESEHEALWQYGLNLGLAYQLVDDLMSVWADPEATGKQSANDLRRRIKSLPVIRAYGQMQPEDKRSFKAMYEKAGELGDPDLQELVELIDTTDAYEYVMQRVAEKKQRAKQALEATSLSSESKALLYEVVEALLPEAKKMGAK